MLLGALVLGIAAGYARGGLLKNLASIELRGEGLMLAALALQWLTPSIARALRLPHNLAFVVWLAAFLLLLAALLLNRDQPALLVAGLGVASNLLVISLNGGMPVWPSALRVVSSGETVTAATLAADPLYHLAGATTRLPFLADAVPVPWPSFATGVISVGDIILMAGVFWLVQDGMLYRGKRRIST